MMDPKSSSQEPLMHAQKEQEPLTVGRADSSDPTSGFQNDGEEDYWAGFFSIGRDFEPSNVTHKFSRSEKKRMGAFNALNFRLASNQVHKRHLERSAEPGLMGKWIMFSMIGLVVGLIAFVMKQTIEALIETRSEEVTKLLEKDDAAGAFFFSIMHSCGFALLATGLVVLIQPAAAGSGVPEVMGYLNGVRIPLVFNIRTAVVKFFSAVAGVASGLPVGPEGPMIHLGAAVGAGLPQGRSKTLGFQTQHFERFRTHREKRDFITGGAAAGVAAAFGAPVGGLLFAMEEVASYWDQKLTWMIFFCTMISTFTINLFASAFESWRWEGNFGRFDENSTILFHVDSVIPTDIAILPTVVVVGLLGGGLGTLFTFLNLKVVRMRAALIKPSRWRQALEPIVVMAIFAVLMFILPYAFSCREEPPDTGAADSGFELKLHGWTCDEHHYNPAATLTLGSGDGAIRHLFSRDTSGHFGYGVLFLYLLCYFVFACYSAGMFISSGLVVPMLLIGALVGRIVGLVMEDMFGDHKTIDPGMFALLGASAFFAGVSRLTVSLTVIMLEISNDIHLLLPIMLSIMIGKWTADFATHSLYHALLEIKCVPFLDQMPVVPKLDCFSAKDIMATPVKCISQRVKVSDVVDFLRSNEHHGFPVVVPSRRIQLSHGSGASHAVHAQHLRVCGAQDDAKLEHHDADTDAGAGAENGVDGENVYLFKGIVLREQLEALLQFPDYFVQNEHDPADALEQEQLSAILDSRFEKRPRSADGTPEPQPQFDEHLSPSQLDCYIDLAPYVDTAALTISVGFSLQLAYSLFRSLGLRHLTVVNEYNEPAGIITRKDLLGQTIEERLQTQLELGHE
jgi:chloride channel 7